MSAKIWQRLLLTWPWVALWTLQSFLLTSRTANLRWYWMKFWMGTWQFILVLLCLRQKLWNRNLSLLSLAMTTRYSRNLILHSTFSLTFLGGHVERNAYSVLANLANCSCRWFWTEAGSKMGKIYVPLLSACRYHLHYSINLSILLAQTSNTLSSQSLSISYSRNLSSSNCFRIVCWSFFVSYEFCLPSKSSVYSLLQLF